MNRFRLLVTRKISPSLALQAGLNGIDVLEKEFIATESVVTEELHKTIGKLVSSAISVAFTSKNAVISVGSDYDVKQADWKVFCLEGATAKEVKKYFGEEKIAGVGINAHALAKMITEKVAGKKVVFFCGNLRRDDLPAELRSNGFDVNEIVVYNTILLPQSIVDDYEAVAFFSPSAVRSFFSANKLKDDVLCLSVGKTTSDAIREFTKNRIVTAKKPSEESVFELAKEIKNNF